MSDANGASPRYFSRSWKMLTSQKGWYKPILLLALGMFVPLFGLLALMGYGLEWARLTAWNVDSAPKQKGVRVGKCIAAGWRGLVVMFVWNFLWAIVVGLIRMVFSLSSLSTLVFLVTYVAGLFVGLIVVAACVRSAIYTKITPGLYGSRIYEMLKRDYKGLFTIVGIPFVSSLIVAAVALVGIIILFFICLADIAGMAGFIMYADALTSADAAEMLGYLGSMLVKCVPVCLLIAYAENFVVAVTTLLEYNAVGLWMRQFDVAHWGGPHEALPETAPVASVDEDEDDEPPVAPETVSPAAEVTPVAPAEQPVAATPVADSSPAEASEPVVSSPAPTGEEEPSASNVDADGVSSPASDSVLDEAIAAEAAAFAMKQASKDESEDEPVEAISEEAPVVPASEIVAPNETGAVVPEPAEVVEENVPAPEEVEADIIEDEPAEAPAEPIVTFTREVSVETTDEFGETQRTHTVETYNSEGHHEKVVDDDSHEVITTLIPPREAPKADEGEEN